MAVSATLLRVMASRAARRELIRSRTQDRIEARWRMTDPFDGHQVNEFASEAAELSSSAQAAIVSLAVAAQMQYFNELELELADFFPEVPNEVRLFGTRESEFASPKAVTSGGVESLRLPIDEPFNRPARQYRAAVSSGADEIKALEQSVDRVRMISGTNMALAEREAEHLMLKEADRQGLPILGHRRVLHPERSVSKTSCGLCVAAATRLYKVAELKPIHDNCECETVAVTAEHDPGMELNNEDLENLLGRLYTDADGNTRDDLKRTRYRVDEHGELQSVLVPQRRGQKVPRFRDPRTPEPVDLDEFAKQYEVAARQLPLMERHLRQALANESREDSAPLDYQRAQIERFKAILAQ